MTSQQNKTAEVSVIASAKNWIEGESVRQLERTAELPGMRRAVGMPDLHPGKGSPIGAAFLSEGRFYPHLVGNDIGCGMALWRTDLEVRKAKRDKWVRKLAGLEGEWEGDLNAFRRANDLAPGAFDASLGTIGGGNHFVELQQFERIHDAKTVAALGLDEQRLMLLVHSGSRGLGESILRDHAARHGAGGLEEDSEEARGYLDRHDHAVAWARVNRSLIARRFSEALGAESVRVLDVCHNGVLSRSFEGRPHWLHRKGAAPADEGAIVIPGSRGTLSYLVQPVGEQSTNLATLAHGAGRKWGRGVAREKLAGRFTPEALVQTALGSRVICEDKALLYEEAPQAYKDIDVVVRDLVDAGHARVLATLRPLITYKTRAEAR